MLHSPSADRPLRHRGFTLIELMVTIAIAAILAALAAPSLQAFFVRNTFASIGNEFQGGLLRARNEAARKNMCTTMCMSDTVDNATPFCKQTGDDWQVGWIVFLNPACNADYGKDATTNKVAAEDMVLVRRVGNASYTLMAQNHTRRIQVNARGNTGMGALEKFDLTKVGDTPSTLAYAFNICLDLMGRSRSVPYTSTCSY